MTEQATSRLVRGGGTFAAPGAPDSGRVARASASESTIAMAPPPASIARKSRAPATVVSTTTPPLRSVRSSWAKKSIQL